MKLLLADDDRTTRIILRRNIEQWNYEVFEAEDGTTALEMLEGTEGLRLAVLDWEMPGFDGVEICRRLAARSDSSMVYTLLLTRRSEKRDMIFALDAGAHDFLSKPVDIGELRSRIAVGRRLIEAQDQLREATSQIQTLHGLLPICASCKNIRDDQGYWTGIENYIRERSEAEFSHSICPDCRKELYPDFPEPDEST